MKILTITKKILIMKKILTLFLLILGTTGIVSAQTVTSGLDDGTPGTLRQQIDMAPSGSTIIFAAAVTSVNLTSEIVINKNLTIIGLDVLNTTINGSSSTRLFNIVGGVVEFNNITLINGQGIDGGGIFNGGNLTLNNCDINNCVANGTPGSGGAIYNDVGGLLRVNNSSMTGNTAVRAGGAIEDGSGAGLSIVLDNVIFEDNYAGTAPGNGGALHITGAGDATLTDCVITSNDAAAEGGGLWNGVGTMTVISSTVNNNTTVGNGADQGGAGIFNAGGTLNVVGGSITNNSTTGTSTSGGGILNDKGVLTVTNTEISGNSSIRAGGGIEDNSAAGNTLTLTNVTLNNNSTASAPGNGGGLHITGPGDSMISNCSVTENSASAEGGGLWNGAGIMTVVNTTIDNNTTVGDGAAQGGAGIFNAGGTLNVNGGSITNNSTTGTSTSGGGILNDLGVLTVTDTEIIANTSIRAGGGIEDNSAAGNTLTLTNVTLNGNSTASSPGNGGGLHITGPGDSMISDCTVTENSASAEGGGLWNGAGVMTVVNTNIVSNTTVGDGADQGGAGIFNAGGTLIVVGGSINNNTTTGTSTSGGGILNDMGVLTVTGTPISGNTSVRAGGGIEDNSTEGNTLTLSNVTLSNNTTGATPGNGGGLHITGPGDSMISDCTVTENSASAEGGGLWNGSGIMTVVNTTVDNNIASGNDADHGGGGIFNNGGTLNINGETQITNNMSTGTAGSGGGLLSTAGNVTIENTTFTGNSANRAGGAIEIIDGDLTFNASSMINNDVNGTAGTPAPGNGGGFHVTGTSGTMIFTNSDFMDNEAGREGGALWNQSGTTMTVTGCTIDGNTSFGADITNGGAGIFNNSGELVITSSTISNNMDMGATAAGGGIHNKTDGSVTVTTSTISSNGSATGGGIYNNGSELIINAATIAFNSATTDGGGIHAFTGANIKNTIVSDNTASNGSDVNGSGYVSSGYNLIGTDDANVFSPGEQDIIGADANLAMDLEVVAGNTATHELEVGSAAFNAGDPNDDFPDQNNQSVFDGRRDIGAHEAQDLISSTDNPTFTNSKIVLFPNPTSSIATMEIPMEFGDEITINIYAACTGILIKNVASNSGTNTIDLGQFPSGMYVIKLHSEKYTHTQLINKIR